MKRRDCHRPVVCTWRVLCALTMALAHAPPHVAAQVRLTIEPEPLRIVGRIGPESDTFTRDLRLTVRGEAIPDLQMMTRGLTLVGDPSVTIRGDQVRIPTGLSLAVGTPRQVPVTIADVPRPGQYRGVLAFTLPGDPPGMDSVVVEAEIGEVPRISTATELRSVSLIQCDNRLTCWLADLLVPGRTGDGERIDLYFRNETRIAVPVQSVAHHLLGHNGGQTVPASSLSFDTSVPLPAGGQGSVGMRVSPAGLPADAYQGTLMLRAENMDGAVSLPFTLNVRRGPGLAAIMLVLGILVGRARKEDSGGEKNRPKWPAWGVSFWKEKLLKVLAVLLWFFTGRRAADWKEVKKQAVFAVLSVALVAFGMVTLYVSNAAFGAKGFGDYLGLFLWGFGADVTQLQINKP
jgi:hypothetical protein